MIFDQKSVLLDQFFGQNSTSDFAPKSEVMLNRYDARLYYTGLVCCYECVSASIVTAEFRMLVGDSCAVLEGITILGFR